MNRLRRSGSFALERMRASGWSGRVLSTCSSLKKDPVYVTTPIYYVNGAPHLGHAYTSVLADVYARFARLRGHECFFLSGTDEHGQKVAQSAENLGLTPQQYADQISAQFESLLHRLDCSHNDFIRTTQPRHKLGAITFWKRLEAAGLLYKGSYSGWYSVRDETFYAEEELCDGKAPTGAPVEWVSEDTYFFRLSAFQKSLRTLLDPKDGSNGLVWPKDRQKDVLDMFAGEGLRDVSVSRTTFEWGIPIPDDPSHVMYVWLDALTNYITALGYPWPEEENNERKKFWPASVHFVGKDILRFHAVYWPAFLMGAGLPLPKQVVGHGWWLSDGEKMSKSLGNVIEPFELVEKYGSDAVRWFFSAEVPLGADGNFTHAALAKRVNSSLVNDFGNLLMRAIVFTQRNCKGSVPCYEELKEWRDCDAALLKEMEEALISVERDILLFNYKSACDSIVRVATSANKYVDENAPWKMTRDEVAMLPGGRFDTVMYTLVETLRGLSVLLSPIIPKATQEVFRQLGVPTEWQTWDSVKMRFPGGVSVVAEKPVSVFPRIELTEDSQITSEINNQPQTAAEKAAAVKREKQARKQSQRRAAQEKQNKP